VALRDRIELVIVAASTLHREAREIVERAGEHVVAIEIAGDLTVERVLTNVAERTFVPRTRREKAEGDRRLRIVWIQRVAGDLLADELAVGLIAVERGDQVVAIRPGVFANAILVVAMRLGEVSGIDPMPGPAFAVVRRG